MTNAAETPVVLVEKSGGIATVTLNRPTAMNALSRELRSAIASTFEALEADPDCAMAHWGVGYAMGPNYNLPWEYLDPGTKAAFLAKAFDAARAALARKDKVTAPERALIEALTARYPQRDAIDALQRRRYAATEEAGVGDRLAAAFRDGFAWREAGKDGGPASPLPPLYPFKLR